MSVDTDPLKEVIDGVASNGGLHYWTTTADMIRIMSAKSPKLEPHLIAIGTSYILRNRAGISPTLDNIIGAAYLTSWMGMKLDTSSLEVVPFEHRIEHMATMARRDIFTNVLANLISYPLSLVSLSGNDVDKAKGVLREDGSDGFVAMISDSYRYWGFDSPESVIDFAVEVDTALKETEMQETLAAVSTNLYGGTLERIPEELKRLVVSTESKKVIFAQAYLNYLFRRSGQISGKRERALGLLGLPADLPDDSVTDLPNAGSGKIALLSVHLSFLNSSCVRNGYFPYT